MTRDLERGALLAAALGVWACTAASALSAPAKIQVAVSVPPQAYLVERIGGDRVDVEVMVPPGTSPAVYEPSPRQLVARTRAPPGASRDRRAPSSASRSGTAT